jgi:hypothetical protein
MIGNLMTEMQIKLTILSMFSDREEALELDKVKEIYTWVMDGVEFEKNVFKLKSVD